MKVFCVDEMVKFERGWESMEEVFCLTMGIALREQEKMMKKTNVEYRDLEHRCGVISKDKCRLIMIYEVDILTK